MNQISTMRFVVLAIPMLALSVAAQDPATQPAAETPSSAPAPYLASGPRELFAKGVELAERGAVEQAKTVFKALTLAYPELPEPYINLAMLLAAEGSVEASADELEAAMRAHPVCRAAYDLEFQRRMGPYSETVLGTNPEASPGTVPPAASVSTVAGSSPPAPSTSVQRPAISGEVRAVRQAADPCLNFRPEPSSSAAVAECLPPDTQVRWLETAGDWSRVALRDGREGWMAAAFLEPVGSD